MSASLVGSEMCIRDSPRSAQGALLAASCRRPRGCSRSLVRTTHARWWTCCRRCNCSPCRGFNLP
eukprot:8486260-Alexandrium_andersonii.AAC.1